MSWFFAPTLESAQLLAGGGGTQTLSATRVDGANEFFPPTVVRGDVTLTQAARLENSQAFFGGVVAPGPITLQLGRINNSSTIYAATIAVGAVTLQPPLLSNANTFYAHDVALLDRTLQAGRLDNSTSIFAPSLSAGAVTLQPPAIVGANSFFPTQVGLGVEVAATIESASQLFSPTISVGGVPVAAPYFENQSQFFGHNVVKGTYLLNLEQAKLLYQIYLLHGLDADLVVGSNFRQAGDVEQTVEQVGQDVTITTTATPRFPLADPGAMIEELAALHGLTVPLQVTPTGRQAGDITQAFSQSGGVTTVTRQ